MSTETLVIIVVAALSGGGLGVWREWRRDRKREPIDITAASMAIARSAGEQALALVEELREEVTRLQAERRFDRAVVAQLRRELGGLRDQWQVWYAELRSEWETLRQSPIPPDPPPAIPLIDDSDRGGNLAAAE